MIEVLATVAIVAILTAVLLPVAARAREASRRTACLSNLRGIGLGVALYAQGSDDAHPLDATSRPEEGWAARLRPYLGGAEILQCPSEPTPLGRDPARAGYVDYFYNRYAFGRPGSAFASPAGSILVMDGIGGTAENWENGTGPGFLDCRGDSALPGATPGRATWLDSRDMEFRLRYATRHGDSANYLFGDGHARALEPASIWNNCTPPVGKASFAYR